MLPLRLCFRGRTLRAAVAGSLMVDRAAQNPLAGARLLRSFASGPQELSITESANALSETMWRKLGARTLTFESVDWVCILKPAGAAVAWAREWFAPAALALPLAKLIDQRSQRIAANLVAPIPSLASHRRDEEASEELLAERIPLLASTYPMHPDWTTSNVRWLLAHTRNKARRGRLYRRVVYEGDGPAIGCYLYYGAPNHIGWVLQILARPGSADPVLDSLLDHAHRNGTVALRGRAHPRLMDALLRRRAIFFHRASTLVHSTQPALLEAMQSGDALVTGLAGEAWTRLIGDRFA